MNCMPADVTNAKIEAIEVNMNDDIMKVGSTFCSRTNDVGLFVTQKICYKESFHINKILGNTVVPWTPL